MATLVILVATAVGLDIQPLDGKPLILRFSEGSAEMYLRTASDVYYVLRGGSGSKPDAIEVYLKESGETAQRHTAGFFKVRGKAEKLSISSDDEEVISFRLDQTLGYIAKYRKPGTAMVSLRIMGKELRFPVNVVEIPILPDAPDSTAIETLGLPDRKTKFFVDWPNTKTIDGLFYSPKAGELAAGEHWTFVKYPHAHLSVMRNKVYGVGTHREQSKDETRNELAARSAWMEDTKPSTVEPKPPEKPTPPQAKPPEQDLVKRSAAAAALLKIGKQFQSRGDKQNAQKRFQKIVDEYSDTPSAKEARELLGK